MYHILLLVVLAMQLASYQAKLLIKVPAELIHLYRSNHLSVTLLLPVWALGGEGSLLVADKTLDLSYVKVLLTILLHLCLTLALPCKG